MRPADYSAAPRSVRWPRASLPGASLPGAALAAALAAVLVAATGACDAHSGTPTAKPASQPSLAPPGSSAASDTPALSDASGAIDRATSLAASDRVGGWRLEDEASPYLREHADNPVEWFPWGQEAFDRARALDRPVFLSIGYSSCHWCHVMERECFMDPGLASRLNDDFVSIKVDREQRPDVDAQYMRALMVLTDSGGWPATLFLTPDGVPFAGGTYFPPEPRFGLPGFGELLDNIHALWTGQRTELLEAASQMHLVLAADELDELLAGDAASDAAGHAASDGAADPAGDAAPAAFDARRTVEQGVTSLVSRLDAKRGGEFGAPKFPPTLSLDFLLRQSQRSGVNVLEFVNAALVAMDEGGLHDHLGGGFHRYCVDENWELPHFEKLLPDNAQLAALYAEAFAITGQPRWAEVARSTLAWMTRELRSPEGLYFGTLDADSLPFDASGQPLADAQAQEGRYYVWAPGEIEAVLGEQPGAAFAALYGVTTSGLFADGRSLPRPVRPRATLGDEPLPGVPTGADFLPWVDASAARLAEARSRQPRPSRDEKCVAGWNGLAATAYARAGALLDDAALRAEAGRLGQALLLLVHEGDVAHQRFDGSNSGAGTLFDHACVARGLLDAYAVAPDPRLIQSALAIARSLLRFQTEAGDFYETLGEDPLLPARSRELFDGAQPSGSSVALELLLRLAPLDDSGTLAGAAERAVARLGPLADKYAAALPALLTALDHAVGPLGEIVLDGSGPEAEALLQAVWRTPLPAALVVPGASALAQALAPDGEPPSLLAERTAAPGTARAWVCVGRVCKRPADDAATLAAQLAPLAGR